MSEDPKQPTALREHMGLFVAIAVASFLLGGGAFGAMVFWRLSGPSGGSKLPAAEPRPSEARGSRDAGPRQVHGKRPTARRKSPSVGRVGPRRAPAVGGGKGRSLGPGRRSVPPRRPPRRGQSLQSAAPLWGAPRWIFDPNVGLIGKMKLLSLAEVRAALPHKKLELVVLQGIPRSAVYDAVHFKPLGKMPKAAGFRYGLGLQLWLHTTEKPIVGRWLRYKQGYPNARQLSAAQKPGKDAFISTRKPLRYVLFRSSRRHGLAILSCHQALCSVESMLKLARKIDARIK